MAENITLLIGRDNDTSRLAVATNKGQLMLFGRDNSVPNTVSRFKPDQKTAHVKITINPITLKMEITNLNPNNYTWVGQERVYGEPVEINIKSKVFMGPDYYPLNVEAITSRFVTFIDASHLETVWSQYDNELMALTADQQKKASQQRLQGIFSMGGMLLLTATMMIKLDNDDIAATVNLVRGIFIFAAFALAVFSFVKSRDVNNSFAMQKRKLDDWLKENYRCPSCGAPIGPIEFKQLGYRKCTNCLGKFYVNSED